MQPHTDPELIRLLEKNTALAQENNVILKKLHRNSIIEMWLRVVWYAVLIGLPFALYFYILEPYLAVIGISLEKFYWYVVEFPGFEHLKTVFIAG